MLAIVGKEARLSSRNLDQHQVRGVDVLVVIGVRDDGCQRFAVRRNLRVADAENLAHPGEIENFAGCRRNGEARRRRSCWRALTEQAGAECDEHSKKTGQETLHAIGP